MENEKDINNIYLADKTEELVIRKGDALELSHPNAVGVIGNLSSPADYFAHHKTDSIESDEQAIDSKKAIVSVDYNDMSIVLEPEPKHSMGGADKITGKLTISKDVAASKVYFGVGSPKTSLRQDFVKFLRYNSRLFNNKEQFSEFLAKLQKLTVEFSGNHNESSDQRGNSELDREKKIKTSLPEKINMFFRVFDGYPAVQFSVEICFELAGNAVNFWLESPDLAKYIEEESRKLIDDQASKLKGLYIIYKG